MEKRDVLILGLISLFVVFFLFIIEINLTGFTIVNLPVGSGANYVDGDVKSDNTIDLITATTLHAGDDGFGTGYRAFLDFDTSSIPDASTISNITLQLTVQTAGTVTADIYALTQTADSRIDASQLITLNSECGGTGSTLIYNDFDFSAVGVGNAVNVTFTSAAWSDLQGKLGSDFFSVCIRSITDNPPASFNEIYFYSNDEGTVSRRPVLFVNYTLSDSTPPNVTIVNPKNATYGIANVSSGILFNVTLSETGTANYTLDNSANNYSMATPDNLKFGAVNNSIAGGSYTAVFRGWDASGNLNATENVTFSVDVVRPLVSVVSPASAVHTTSTTSINITLNEAGICVYSVDNGVTNLTLTSANGGKEFTGTTASLSNAEYNISAYCSDNAGNKNESVKINFTISVSGGGGGGGGGGCTVESWSCGLWETCLLPPGSARVGVVFGEQSRTCTSNCGTHKVETQVCNVTFSDECENQCDGTGDRCNENSVESCELVDGCFKIVNIEDCGSTHRCEGGICIEIEENNTVTPIQYFSEFVSNVYGHSDLPIPSDFIPGPPIVVNSAAGVAGASLLWLLIWLIWMAVSVPFFLRRLNHHSISIFDSANELKIFDKKGKIDNGRLLEFLKALQKSYGRLVFAEKDSEMIKYLVEDGFIEVRLDRPFVVMGHFSEEKHAKVYGQVMKNVLERFKAGNVKVMSTTERTTFFRALRAYMRERKAKKMLRRAFRK